MLTPKQVEQLIDIKATHTIKESAKIMGIAYSTARYWLSRARKEGHVIPNQKAGRKPLPLRNIIIKHD